MKGAKHPKNDVTINPSGNENIHEVIGRVDLSRRRFVQGSVSATVLASAGGLTLSGIVNTVEAAPIPPSLGFAGIGFESIAAETTPLVDAVRVPLGYNVETFVAWGDPIMPGGVPYAGAIHTSAEQEKQFGMHCDGMHFFPFPTRGGFSNDRGVFACNNEYTDENLLWPDGQNYPANYPMDKTRKSQAGHGVSFVEARKVAGKWSAIPTSGYGRRITSNTPMKVSGAAAGHDLLKSNAYMITPAATIATGGQLDGMTCYGTINNCAHGITPWGTYLTCEENFNGNFGTAGAAPSTATEQGKLNNRYGVTAAGFGYNWFRNDVRFDIAANQKEPNLFGWVVEIDPFNPNAMPVKRTSLGRFKHESAQYVVDSANRVAFYQGDDERNEYIYKFVCAGAFNPTNRGANLNLLDSGTLYVAKFTSTPAPSGSAGQWIALEPGTIGLDGFALRDNPNFSGANDAEVLAKILIKARMAADAVGATMMDRPEWTGARPRIYGYNEVEIYCTLTNNNRRGASPASVNNPAGTTGAGAARPPVDAANPAANNIYGHIIRWREAGQSVTATTFEWDIFVQCGDTATTRAPLPTNDFKGNIVDVPNGSADFGAPDGLWFDYFGRLWVQTDQAGNGLGDWLNIGANCMVCADPNTKEIRRFLTAPPNAEVTGVTMSPDGKTMWVGLQHPGEDSTPAAPTAISDWPASQWAARADGTPLPPGRPRSSVVVITRADGGIIGA